MFVPVQCAGATRTRARNRSASRLAQVLVVRAVPVLADRLVPTPVATTCFRLTPPKPFALAVLTVLIVFFEVSDEVQHITVPSVVEPVGLREDVVFIASVPVPGVIRTKRHFG